MKDFTQQIQDALFKYGNAVDDIVMQAVKHECEEARKRLRADSPVNGGKYQRGWQYKVTTKRGWTHAVVFNGGSHAALTHLLEKGHLLKNGNRAPALVHIAPVDEWVAEDYPQYVTDMIQEISDI